MTENELGDKPIDDCFKAIMTDWPKLTMNKRSNSVQVKFLLENRRQFP